MSHLHSDHTRDNSRTVNIALFGLGHVGRSVLQILTDKEQMFQDVYGIRFRIVCVADSSGVAVSPSGFDPAALRRHKEGGDTVSRLNGFLPDISLASALDRSSLHVVFEATPVNLQHGDPGLSLIRAALDRGIHCVLANKGPLVLAFQELHDRARRSGASLAFSATVCGGLPVLNVGRRDLIGAEISLVQGIFNSTSNYILGQMVRGQNYHGALAEAQRRGIAEADPSLDVGGWDTANKLVIIVNSVLRSPATLLDVDVTGITDIDADQLQVHGSQGRTVKLVARAERDGNRYRLSVRPTALPADDFLAGCQDWDMGVEFHTDIYETLYLKIREESPLPTAAAMLRDGVNLLGGVSRSIE